MLRAETPCDFGNCPYKAEYGYTCETYCSEEPSHNDWDTEWDTEWEDDEDYTDWDDEPDVDECGFDPYEGCYTYDC